MAGKSDSQLFSLARDSEVCGAGNPGVRLDEIRARRAVLSPNKGIDGSHAVFVGHNVRDEACLVDWPVDSYTNYKAGADLASGQDIGLPSQRRIDVVTHVASARHAIRDHEWPGEIGEHIYEPVDVHVPQAGNEEFPTTIDDLGAGGDFRRRCRPGIGNSIALDQDSVVLVRLPACDVDYRNGGDRD